MTTQPSIESLRADVQAAYEGFLPYQREEEIRNKVLAALTELENLRTERDALIQSHMVDAHEIAGLRSKRTSAESSEAAAIKRAEEAGKLYHEAFAIQRNLGDALTFAEQRAEAAEARCEALGARVEALVEAIESLKNCPPADKIGYKEAFARWAKVKALIASTPTADLAAHDAKVRDPLEAKLDALAATVEAWYRWGRAVQKNPWGDPAIIRDYRRLCDAPDGTVEHLKAHDTRIRREEREAAAKKCAEAYWAMVAPRDHAAMHPTIEFWRDALGLEPMSPAEHAARAAIEPRNPEIVLVDDLAMLVRQLVHTLRKHSPDNETARKAMDYLKRNELQGSPLRSILSPAPDAAQPNNQQEQP